MHRDESTVIDIAQAAQAIIVFTGGFSRETFLDDLKTRSAVLYQLLVIGEGVKRLSSDLKKQYPRIPWRNISGMRDHLIHAYDLVDWDEVWVTSQRDVPALLDELYAIAADHSWEI